MDAVAYHLRQAAEDLRSIGLKTSCIQVILGTSRHGDYFLQGGSEILILDTPTSDSFELMKEAQRLVERLFKPNIPYKKAGVLLSQFSPETVEQLTFFSDALGCKTSELMPLIDKLNAREGAGTILLGSHLKTSSWQSSQESRSPAYTTNWNDIAKVKT
jgi:DNA polymerase V